MNVSEQFDLLVGDLAALSGMTFERDEDGVWQIPMHGGDILVCLAYRPASGQVIAFARVETMIPGVCAAQRARALLEANAFWRGTDGFTLAMDPETRQLIALDRRAPSFFATVDKLAHYVNVLVTLVEDLRAELRHLNDAAEIAEENGLEVGHGHEQD